MAAALTGQANQTFGTASNNAANYGGAASTIQGQLNPFLMQRLTNPQGYSQGDMGAMLANAFGSAGGATSGITGQADLQAGRSRNDAGFSTALADAARARTQAAAGTSEGIAANNAGVKLGQQSEAAKMLQGLYGTDVGAANDSLNTADRATQTGISAYSATPGWLSGINQTIGAIGGAATGAGNLGFKPLAGCWIAAELYGGWNDPRTIDVRRWIFGDFAKTKTGRIVCALYLRLGEQIADLIHSHRWMRKPFKALFDCALRKARA